MKIIDFLNADAIDASLRSTDKASVMAELAGLLARRVPGADVEKLREVLLDRERLSSTGIGDGVAIPHGKLPGLPGLTAAFGISREGIDFEALDGRPTHLFFALLAPENSAGIHLKALARISRLFKNPAFRKAIVEASDPSAIYALIASEDSRT